jgi:Fur family ferric uptake transcriptional regulator
MERDEEGPAAAPAALRAAGRRLTRQRQAIWQAVLAAGDEHLSVDDVVARVRAQVPLVNASTVYRTLELLVAEGLLLRADLGAGRAYYERARTHRHHHLVCERCGSVRHLHDETLGELPERIRDATGYVLGERELSFYGLCPACQAREAGATT